jgi:hypothetical protein
MFTKFENFDPSERRIKTPEKFPILRLEKDGEDHAVRSHLK